MVEMEISSTPPLPGDSIVAAAEHNQVETTPTAVKRKRNLPGMPGEKLNTLFFYLLFCVCARLTSTTRSISDILIWSRSRCGSDRVIAENAAGNEQIRVRDLQQGVPARPESAAPPPRPQPSVEAPAAVQ